MTEQDIEFANLLFKHGDIVKNHIHAIIQISDELEYYPTCGVETNEISIFNDCINFVNKHNIQKSLSYVAERRKDEDLYSILVYYAHQKERAK